jgi:hypothetical protein
MKRAAAGDRAVEENSLLLTPLGAGREVGRSCLLLEYKGLTVLLDCGVLPSFAGRDSLPYLDHVPPASVDVVVITCVRARRSGPAAAAPASTAGCVCPLPSHTPPTLRPAGAAATFTWTTLLRCPTLRSASLAFAAASLPRLPL